MPAKKASPSLTLKSTSGIDIPANLLWDIRDLILTIRGNVSWGVNAAPVLFYWKMGERIGRGVLKEKRAEYGEQIVSTLSQQLQAGFGRCFANTSDRRVEAFELGTRGIRVAEYLTALPPKKLLEQKLHHAIHLAQQRAGSDL